MRSATLALMLGLCVAPSSARADERGRRVEATGVSYNATQHFALRFDDASVSVQPPHGDPLVLQTAAVGRGPNARFVPPGQRSARDAVVTLSRPWLDEWFHDTDAGLEHGWSLPADPLPGDGPLELRVDVLGGRTPVLVAPDEVRFLDRGGVTPLHYTHPAAFDATGAALRVELDVEGSQVVVRVYDEGARYPLRVDPLIWGETNTLSEPGPGMLPDFGGALDLDPTGDRLAVGGVDSMVAPGAVYVFVRTGARWVVEAELRSPDASARENFGHGLAIEGDVLLVSAPDADTAAGIDAGAVYVFHRGALGWAHAGTLGPPGPFTEGRFGSSIAMDGDRVVVEACSRASASPGELFFFEAASGAFRPDGRMVPSRSATRQCRGGPAHNLAMDSDRIAYGAAFQGVDGNGIGEVGAAFVLERRDGAWTETAFLRPAWPVPYEFGLAVTLTGDRLVVGAMSYVAFALPDNRGYAYVYERRGDTWVEAHILRAPPSPSYDFFGLDVVAWDDRLAVGSRAYAWPDGVTQGAVFVYRFDAMGTPSVETVLSPPTGARLLGSSLTAVGDTIAAEGVASRGIVRIFELRLEQGDPCGADADCLSGFCTEGVCCDVACGGGDPADCQVCSLAEGAAADGVCSPAPAGGTCRPALGECDVDDVCDGASLHCADAVIPPGGVCRPATGRCDVAEVCDGLTPTCPPDAFLPAETECRAPVDACDPLENCSGDGAECPADIADDCDPDAGATDDAGRGDDAGSDPAESDASSGAPDADGSDAGPTTVTYGSCGCRISNARAIRVELSSLLLLLLLGLVVRRGPRRIGD